MKLKNQVIAKTKGTILVHNINYASGRKAIGKGTVLESKHLDLLAELGLKTVMVAILEADDVGEDEAAFILGQALQKKHLRLKKGIGGRVNFQAEVDSLLMVAREPLLALNTLAGITLATRPDAAIVGPKQTTKQVATLKIIPYAIKKQNLQKAVALAQQNPPIIRLRTIPTGKKTALLLVGDEAVQAKLKSSFEPPTRTRLSKLNATLSEIKSVPLEHEAICEAAIKLAATNDLLVIAGQTSIMDADDVIPHALKTAGATIALHGVPVEPGNLLALAYFPQTPVLCAPGCARSLKHNVVDLALPRLLLGDRLTAADVAAWGWGGLLDKVVK